MSPDIAETITHTKHGKKKRMSKTTTKRHKDFGAGSGEEVEPLSFTLHNEEFIAVPEVQGKLLIELVRQADSEDPSKTAELILTFFEEVLEEESYERFDALLSSKKIVRVETLAEIMGWLMEEYTNRPEAPTES